jgi:hypothetical protein
MRRFAIGLFLVLHGLGHAALGMSAQDLPRRLAFVPETWMLIVASALFVVTMPVFVAAGFGLWGVIGLRSVWRPLTSAGVVASCLLLVLFAPAPMLRAFGLGFDALALAMCGAVFDEPRMARGIA